MSTSLMELFQYCESPIERNLLAAIIRAFADADGAGVEMLGLAPAEYTRFMRLDGSKALVHMMPQAVVSPGDDTRYRVDFLLICGVQAASRKCFAIECDGHDWHEKTKQQVARDKRRDRRLIEAGIVPIRFSGSEICREADDCAEYIRSLARGTVGDILGGIHDR